MHVDIQFNRDNSSVALHESCKTEKSSFHEEVRGGSTFSVFQLMPELSPQGCDHRCCDMENTASSQLIVVSDSQPKTE